jgi:uncharacterized protein YkwD
MRPRLVSLSALAAVALFSGCAAGVLPEPTAATAAAVCEVTATQEVIARTNAIRRERGLPELQVDDRLSTAARAHAADLARRNAAGHLGGDGSLPDARAARTGYSWELIGENVAVGQPTPSQVVMGWMSSPDHRRNLLSSEARHVGVGYAYRPETQWRHFWTAVYGNSSSSTETSDGCHP